MSRPSWKNRGPQYTEYGVSMRSVMADRTAAVSTWAVIVTDRIDGSKYCRCLFQGQPTWSTDGTIWSWIQLVPAQTTRIGRVLLSPGQQEQDNKRTTYFCGIFLAFMFIQKGNLVECIILVILSNNQFAKVIFAIIDYHTNSKQNDWLLYGTINDLPEHWIIGS